MSGSKTKSTDTSLARYVPQSKCASCVCELSRTPYPLNFTPLNKRYCMLWKCCWWCTRFIHKVHNKKELKCAHRPQNQNIANKWSGQHPLHHPLHNIIHILGEVAWVHAPHTLFHAAASKKKDCTGHTSQSQTKTVCWVGDEEHLPHHSFH